MFGQTDPDALRTGQYRDSTNLNARAELHRRFSANPQGWLPWLREQIGLRPGERVLEVGGGPGWLWRDGTGLALPAGAHVTLSDLSTGMVREARAGLAGHAGFGFAVLAAGSLPFAADTFDVVLANHMLYHVPDLPAAVRELARVLVLGGRLVAATNGTANMQELYELVHAVVPAVQDTNVATIRRFSLENAAAILAPAFSHVTIRRYADALWVTDASPLVDYACSMAAWQAAGGRDRASALEAVVRARLEAEGGIAIRKDGGVAVAYRE